MQLETTSYAIQQSQWPQTGKHILAQYTDEYVVVYQAYQPEIGLYAAENQCFGGAFSYTRMSWIKPNFLWMMYRCGWGDKSGQEVILAVYLKRSYFDSILASAWPSTNCLGISDEQWKIGLTKSEVRLQWDPDHDPYGKSLPRRAIQLGLRGNRLLPFKGESILRIENISEFVRAQKLILDSNSVEQIITPVELVYPIAEAVRKTLCM